MRKSRFTVRRRIRKRIAGARRLHLDTPARPDQRWSMDFVSNALADGRVFRMLNIIDDYNPLSVYYGPFLVGRTGRRVKRMLTFRPLGSLVAGNDSQGRVGWVLPGHLAWLLGFRTIWSTKLPRSRRRRDPDALRRRREEPLPPASRSAALQVRRVGPGGAEDHQGLAQDGIQMSLMRQGQARGYASGPGRPRSSHPSVGACVPSLRMSQT